MAVFAYRATDLDTSIVDGTLVADTPRQARDQLRQRGLSVHELVDHKSANTQQRRYWSWAVTSAFLKARHNRSTRVVSFVRELSTLLAVGMPLLEAIDTIAKQQRGSFAAVLLLLRDRIASGASLADAMADQPEVFDPVTINMTHVGEDAGTLEEVLAELALFKERSAQLRGRIGSALLYPFIVLLVGMGVSIFLMTYVVPGLLDSLVEAGKPLPGVTQLVKTVSDFLLLRWWVLVITVIALAGACAAIGQSQRGRRLWHRLLLRLPLLGDLIRKQAVVRIAFVVSTLMRSGIAFEKAIAIVGRSTTNLILREALQKCEVAVCAGCDIATALEQTDAFPPTVVQVFALGQQSGRLEEMLERLAVDYDRQVTTAATRFTAALEPILILLLAIIVGTIAFATILPILEVGNVI